MGLRIGDAPLVDVSFRGAAPASRRGFTLIEVLITLVILSTGIVSVLKAFGTAASVLGESRDSLWTSLLTSEKIEEAVMAAEDSTGGAALLPASGQVPAAGMVFRWTRQVREVERLPPDAKAGRPDPVVLNEVTVTLWRDGTTQERSVTTYAITGRRQKEEGVP